MADIEQFETEIAQDEEIVDIPIVQKNGAPFLAEDGTTPCTVGVYGSDAKVVRLAKDAIQRRMLRKRSTKLEPADIMANRIQVAAAAVVRWHGWTAKGQPFPCTPENVRAFLRSDHILRQVEEGIEGHADFFANNSTS